VILADGTSDCKRLSRGFWAKRPRRGCGHGEFRTAMAHAEPSISWQRIGARGLLAGLVGAVLIEAYLWLTTLVPNHGDILVTWQWVASTVFGKGALANQAFAWVGLALHLLVSIGWAAGYAYLAATRPFLSARWPVSGIVYGVLVYVLMQAVLLVDGNLTLPATPLLFVNAVVAHVIFFGLPVAFVVARMDAQRETMTPAA